MKPDDWTDEQLRIAIALHQGWSVVERHKVPVLLNPQGQELWHYSNRGTSFGPCRSWDEALCKGSHYAKMVPNYPSDLNAVHAAIMSKVDGHRDEEYRENLALQTGQYSTIFKATAREHCLAYVLTFNLPKP
jgi:hypothetical protein